MKTSSIIFSLCIFGSLAGCGRVTVTREHYVCDGAFWRDADGGKILTEEAYFGFKVEKVPGASQKEISVRSLLIPDRDRNDPGPQFGYFGANSKGSKVTIDENGMTVTDENQMFIYVDMTQTVHYKRVVGSLSEHFNGRCKLVEGSNFWVR